MADDERRGEGDEERDPDREAILARRRRFVAIALSGLASAGAAGGAAGCYESHGRGETTEVDAGEPMACLRRVPDAGRDAEPEPCLGVLPPDAGRDAEPAPCLDVAPPDAGREDAGGDAGPAVCLSMAARDADDESDEA